MRKIPLLIVALLALAGSAQAQESYSLAASAGNVTSLSNQITALNAMTCLSKSAAGGATCTQAQACTAYSSPGGSSCTAAQARSVGARIWPLTQAGREEYVTFLIALPRFLDLDGGLPALKTQVLTLQLPSLSGATKDSACTTLGLPAGCFP